VRNGLAAAAPGQSRADFHIRSAVGRLRLAGLRRNVQEANFTESVLAHHAIAAIDVQTHVLDRNPAEIDRRVGRVRGLGGGPSEFKVAQSGPVDPVLGVLDRYVLDSEAQEQLELDVVVPDQHLMELVDAVELKLYPQWIGAGHRQPHILGLGRMLMRCVQTGTVDRPLRSGGLIRDAVGRRDDAGDRIGERLGGEAPDIALEDGGTRSGIDLVDAPVVGRLEVEHTRRIVTGRRLALTDQHAHRVGPAGVVDVIEHRAEIHIMRSGKLTRRPAQDYITRHIVPFIHRNGISGEFRGPTFHYGKYFVRGQNHVVEPNVVHEAAEVLDPARVVADEEGSIAGCVGKDQIAGHTQGGKRDAVFIQDHGGPIISKRHMCPNANVYWDVGCPVITLRSGQGRSKVDIQIEVEILSVAWPKLGDDSSIVAGVAKVQGIDPGGDRDLVHEVVETGAIGDFNILA